MSSTTSSSFNASSANHTPQPTSQPTSQPALKPASQPASQPASHLTAPESFSGSDRSTWSKDEVDFKLDLNALSVDSWSAEQRKTLLFLIACCLPTVHNRARAAANRIAQHKVLQKVEDTKSDGEAWEEEYLQGLATLLKLDQYAVQVVLPIVGVTADAPPFVSSLPAHSFRERVIVLLLVLHDSLVRCAGYDARVRVMLRRLAGLLDVRWEWFVLQENRYASALRYAVDKQHGVNDTESSSSRALRYFKIGSAVVIGGVAIGLTGGLLAAPLLGAGLAGIGLASAGATVGALVASTGGVILVSSIFGIAGGSLAGYKMNKRTSGLQEFQFQNIGAGIKDSMEVLLCLNGWLDHDNDYYTVWSSLQHSTRELAVPRAALQQQLPSQAGKSSADQHAAGDHIAPTKADGSAHVVGLAPSAEVYSLKWESAHLHAFGVFLQSMTMKALAKGYAIGQIKSLLIGSLLAAVAWPMYMVRVSNFIDDSYAIIKNKSEMAAIELANVIETRIQGHRPVSLIGYSMGARVIFLALEELVRRRQARLVAARKEARAANAAKTAKTDSGEQQQVEQQQQHDTQDEKDGTEGVDLPAVRVSADHEQQVLTTKGYQQLPSTSITLNADGVIENVYLLGTPLEIDMARWLRVRSLVCGRLVNVYCADDWLLKFYFAAREVTNSISGLRPVTLDIEKKTAEAQEAVQRLTDKQKQMQQKTEDSAGSGSGGGSGSDSSVVDSAVNGSSSEEDERAVDESEGVGQLSLHSTESEQQPLKQKRRGGDEDGYGIENWDLTGVVDGHTDYPRKIHEILGITRFRP